MRRRLKLCKTRVDDPMWMHAAKLRSTAPSRHPISETDFPAHNRGMQYTRTASVRAAPNPSMTALSQSLRGSKSFIKRYLKASSKTPADRAPSAMKHSSGTSGDPAKRFNAWRISSTRTVLSAQYRPRRGHRSSHSKLSVSGTRTPGGEAPEPAGKMWSPKRPVPAVGRRAHQPPPASPIVDPVELPLIRIP